MTKFVKGPTTSNDQLRVGEKVNISGCSLYSPVKLNANNMYWIKDGKIKIAANVSTKVKQGEIIGGIRTFGYDYNYFELTYAVTNYTMQGYYQCVVFHPKYMSEEVKSTAVSIQFQGEPLHSL